MGFKPIQQNYIYIYIYKCIEKNKTLLFSLEKSYKFFELFFIFEKKGSGVVRIKQVQARYETKKFGEINYILETDRLNPIAPRGDD